MKHLLAVLLLAVTLDAFAADEDGFVPLFNGRDLSGWTNINCAPETWSVRDGKIFCTGRPVGALRTTRHYENFILEVEWRHLQSGGNSGVFIWGSPISAPGVPFLRGIEVQVLDHGYATNYEKQHGKKSDWFTTHGDVFPIHGATMKPLGRHNGSRSFPSEDRSKGVNEWNHYRIVCNNGSLRLHVNGKEVSGGDDCNYRKGYLALESEGAPIEFRNLRIKELPTGNPAPELVAPLDPGWQSLFTGLDFRGWRTNAATAARWVTGGRIGLKEGTANANATLWTEKEYGDAEFLFDCNPAKPAAGKEFVPPTVFLRGQNGEGAALKLTSVAPGRNQRVTINVKGREVVVSVGDKETQKLTLPATTPARGTFGLLDTGAAMSLMNLHVRDL